MTQEALLTPAAAAEWIERLEAEDVPCAPVLTRNDVLSHEQVRANGLIVEVEHPVAGPIRHARPAARFSVTEAAIRQGAPVLGEHTIGLLSELGYTADDIEALRQEGTIGTPAEAVAS